MARRLIGVRLDIETRSREDLKKSGVYRYAECPDFAVLLLAYSPIRRDEDGSEVLGKPRLLDFDNSESVRKMKRLLLDPTMEKHAFNAAFERVCLSRWVGLGRGTYIDPANWHCSSVLASVNGIQGSLDEVAKAVRSPINKDTEGKRLIRLFCQPQKDGEFADPADHPADFARFGSYCEQDVATEAVVARVLPAIPDDTQAEYEMDQRINDRGVRHHKRLAEQAVAQVEAEKNRVMARLTEMTGVSNPNSGKQMMDWLSRRGYPMSSLDKAHREEALADPLIPQDVAEALRMKGAASLSSVAKHTAALNTRCRDGRIRGSLQFYGAHTGREAGRGIQPQNLPRYEAPDEDRRLLVSGNAGSRAPEIAKGSVRASLVPAKGHVFVVCDYNAIEARVLGWLAGEKWVMEEFAGDGKIYEATAATMFGVDKASLVASLKACGKCGSCPACETRSKGKVSALSMGYAGGAGALVTMGAEAAGIDVGNYPTLNKEWKGAGSPGKFHEWESDRHDYPELLRLRDQYRNASPATVRFWKDCGMAWDIASSGEAVRFGHNRVVAMIRDGRHNRMILPSGRSIWYRYAMSHRDEDNPERVDRRTFIGKAGGVGHRRVDTHGGKLTENCVQAVARDVLFDLMRKVEAMMADGWPGKIVLHVHDEVVIEVPKESAEQVLADTLGLMDVAPSWGDGLLVKGAGEIMPRYGK